MVASTTVSMGIAVRTGVRELQVLAALVAHRLEAANGGPADPALVKRLAVDLYLDPKSAPDLRGDRLRLVRVTRKWILSGAFGRKTSKQATKALAAAEKIDCTRSSRAGRAADRRRRLQAGAPCCRRTGVGVDERDWHRAEPEGPGRASLVPGLLVVLAVVAALGLAAGARNVLRGDEPTFEVARWEARAGTGVTRCCRACRRRGCTGSRCTRERPLVGVPGRREHLPRR